MKENKVNDNLELAKLTFQQAKEYHLATIVVLEKPVGTLDDEILMLMIPGMSITAFTCELYLKTLSLLSNKCLTGHNLFSLYSELNKEIKNDILREFSLINIDKTNFLIELKDVSEAFIAIRYANEVKSIAYNAKFLVELMTLLFKLCKKDIFKLE